MAQDTKNFKVSEFACKCGCGFDDIDQRVMDMAQALRDELGVPVRVNSGCRCEKHNAKVGGVKNSKHLTGKAADLSCSKGNKALYAAAQKLFAEGKLPNLDYCRIRGYRSWIHIDCGGKRNNRWDE